MTFAEMLKHPSAFLPVVMSLAALATVAAAFLLLGVDGMRQPDEGAAAHIWRILIAGQVPIVAFFGVKWLPAFPRQALAVLALQAAAGLAALAPVFLLGL
jgi:hypothetical protein